MALQLYIFKTGSSSYKVGVSSNVPRRRNDIQTGCPTNVEIFKIYEVPNAFEVETVIHNHFSDYTTSGEWFDPPSEHTATFLGVIEAITEAACSGQSLEKWIKEEGGPIQQFRLLLKQQGFSERTVRAYLDWARRFLKFHNGKSSEALNLADLDSYLEANANLPPSTQRLVRASLILFFELV